MNSGKIVVGGWTGRVDFEGSTRGPRGPKKCLLGSGDNFMAKPCQVLCNPLCWKESALKIKALI